jgi:hypothetical protein
MSQWGCGKVDAQRSRLNERKPPIKVNEYKCLIATVDFRESKML